MGKWKRKRKRYDRGGQSASEWGEPAGERARRGARGGCARDRGERRARLRLRLRLLLVDSCVQIQSVCTYTRRRRVVLGSFVGSCVRNQPIIPYHTISYPYAPVTPSRYPFTPYLHPPTHPRLPHTHPHAAQRNSPDTVPSTLPHPSTFVFRRPPTTHGTTECAPVCLPSCRT